MSLSRETAVYDGCQSSGGVHTPFSAPWRGGQYESKKARLYRYLLTESDGLPLAKIVRDVWGDLEQGSSEYHRVRRLAERFYRRYPDMFKTDRRNGILWVSPRLGVFNLRQQYAKRKTPRGQADGLSDSIEHQSDSQSRPADSPQYPKDRVRSVLEKYSQFPSDNVKQSFLREFVTELDAIEDKWQVFERIRGQGAGHLCIPYTNRFNSPGTAGDIQEGFVYGLETAAERHNSAVVLTVTTDPKIHSGLSDALDSLSKNKGRLMSWLSTEYQLGYRPDNLSVLEFSRNGLPHYHIVLFGVSWAVSQEQLSAKWSDYGQGSVVDIRTAESFHDSNQWLLHDDDQGKVSLSYYLGKSIRDLQTVAQTDVSVLEDRVESGDISLWRQCLYWATERQYFTCSPSLKEPTESGDLPHVSVWRFVGCAKYRDIPAHVRRNATFADRPPPTESDSTAKATVG
jgi:hypothetical protein